MPLGSCSVSCSDIVLEQGDREVCPEIFGVLFFWFWWHFLFEGVCCGWVCCFGVFFGIVVVVCKDLFSFSKGCEAEEKQLVDLNN